MKILALVALIGAIHSHGTACSYRVLSIPQLGAMPRLYGTFSSYQPAYAEQQALLADGIRTMIGVSCSYHPIPLLQHG